MKIRSWYLYITILSTVIFIIVSFSKITFSATPGTIKWSLNTSVILGAPVIANDGTIYIEETEQLIAISPDGNIKWHSEIPGCEHLSSPAISNDGTVYVIALSDPASYFYNNNETTNTTNYIYAINPNGQIKWKVALPYNTGWGSTPAIGKDGTIYIPDNRNLYAINPHGQIKWKIKFSNNTYGWGRAPAIGTDGTIYISDDNRNLYAITPDGQIKWKIKFSNNTHTAGGTPVIGKDGTIYISDNRDLYAINPHGQIKWTCNISSQNLVLAVDFSAPAIGTDGTIYIVGIGDSNYCLYAINPRGQIKWKTGNLGSYPSETESIAWEISPAIGKDGTIYVEVESGNYNNCVYAINPNGQIKWKIKLPYFNTIECPAIGRDGTVYVVTPNLLYAINSNSGGLANSPWPKFQHDNQNTGNVKGKSQEKPLQIIDLEPLVPIEKIIYNPIIEPKYINIYFLVTFNKDISGLVDNSTIVKYFSLFPDDTRIRIYSNIANTINKIANSYSMLLKVQVPINYVLENSNYTLITNNGLEASVDLQKDIVPIIYKLTIYPKLSLSGEAKVGLGLDITLLGEKIVSGEVGMGIQGTVGIEYPDIISMEYYNNYPEKQYFSLGYGVGISFQVTGEVKAGGSVASNEVNTNLFDTSVSTGLKAELLGFPFIANVAEDQYNIASSVIPFIISAITHVPVSSLINIITQGKPFDRMEVLLSGEGQFDLSAGHIDINLPILNNSSLEDQNNSKKLDYKIKIIKPSNNTDSEISGYFNSIEGLTLYDKNISLKLNFKLSKDFYSPYKSIINPQLLFGNNSGPSTDILGNSFQDKTTEYGFGLSYTSTNYNKNTYLQLIDSDDDFTYYNNLQINPIDILNANYNSTTIFNQLLNNINSFSLTKYHKLDYDWEFLTVDLSLPFLPSGEFSIAFGVKSYWKYPKTSGIYKEHVGYLEYYKLNDNSITYKLNNNLINPLNIWYNCLLSFQSQIENMIPNIIFGIKNIIELYTQKINNKVYVKSTKGNSIITLANSDINYNNYKDQYQYKSKTIINKIPNKLNNIGIIVRDIINNCWPIKFDPRIIYLYPKNNQYNTLSNIEAILYPEDDITADNATLLGVYRFNGYGWQYVDSKWDNKYKGYKFKLTHYGYYALIYNFSNDTNFMQKHIINLKPQQSTILYSKEIKLANNATAVNTEFEIQPYKCASIEGNSITYGMSPVVIPKTIKTDQYGILHIPVKAVAEGEAFYKITSKYGYAYDTIRIVVSKNKGIDPNFKVAIQLLYNKDKMVPVNATVTMKAITSYNSTSIKWYIKTPGNDVIKKGLGYSITFTPRASSVYKVICMATDRNGFWHTAYALLPVTNPNKDSDGDGISDNVEKFFGLNPKDPSDGKKFISAVENSKNCFIKIISGQGTIENIKKLPARYFGNIPNNLKPICIYNYTVNNMSVGGSVELQALFNITNLENYKIYRFVNNRWIDISDQVSYNTDSITYYLTDGGKYDNDGLANGKIEDTIMIAKKIATATWQDITSALKITKSRPIFDRHHRCFLVYVNIKNTSGQDIYGPIRLVITNPTLPIDTNCPLGMQVAGKTSNGNSYFEIIPKGGVLKAGASTGNLRINFKLARKRLSFGVAIEQLEQIGE